MRRDGFEIVCVGASAGGLAAVQTLLSGLAGDFALPVVIVQHRGRTGGEGLGGFLQRHCALPVSEPDDKDEIQSGHVYVAPRDYHLLVGRREGFALSTSAPVNFARPSIDLLFESAADAWGPGALGVVLTGANRDGALGLARIKERGGGAIVQEPASAQVREMPDAAIALARPDHVAALPEIAALLNQLSSQVSVARSSI
ncbi:MAG: chemotaxis protein CheB [Pyrinomonadaceae bacterium]